MKIETHPLEDQQIKMIIEVEAETLEQSKHRAARQIAQRTKIPGFRPGKAPYPIVQRHVGDEALLEEGLELLVNDLYPKALQDAQIKPYGPGKFEKLSSLDPVTLEFIVPLIPEVTLGEYHTIRFPYELKVVTDQEVDAVQEDLRQRQAVEEPVDRPAQAGDRLHIQISAERAGVEEKDPPLIRQRPLAIIISDDGEDSTDEWPFSGFSKELVGAAAGDHKVLQHTFTEEAEFVSLRGVTADFNIIVEEVKSRSLPELNDEFAQSLGEYEDLASLRTEIRKNLEQQARDAYHSEYDEKVITSAIEMSTIKYPPQMLEDQIDDVIEQLERRLKGQNLDLNLYMKTRNLDEQGLREEAKLAAENRLKRSLVLMEISESENIQVEKDELQSETERTLEAMTRFMPDSEMRKMSRDDLFSNLVGNIFADMKIDRTIERLRAIAKNEVAAPLIEDMSKSADDTEGQPQASKDQGEPVKKKRKTTKKTVMKAES